MRSALKYGFLLIAGYIVVANAPGFGRAITATGQAASGLTTALQGRKA